MIKMLNACTEEIDELDLAVAEILEQLDLEHSLLQHSAAFLTCSDDFIESGMVEAVCAALPFDVVGCTTLTGATNSAHSTMMLSLSVLTSDDCHFSTVATDDLTDGLSPIAGAYREAAGRLPAEPSLILAFAPMIRTIGGELILNELDAAAGGAPIFGTIACDHDTSEYTSSYTFHNGKHMKGSLALLLVEGAVNPRFFVTYTTEDKIQKQKAIITDSEGSILKEVNNMSTIQYLQSIGLSKGDGVEGMSAIPFVVNYNDGTRPVVRAIYMVTPEGYTVCGGAMPKGATLAIGAMDFDDIIETASQTMGEIMAQQQKNGLILFPCLGRSLVLGTDLFAEIEEIRKHAGALPFHLAYSGGEICPVYTPEGKPVNRFHNFTFIACLI